MINLLKKQLLNIALVAGVILLVSTPVKADHIRVFLLGGQSNMVGTGADTNGLPTALQSPQADVLFYYGSSLTTLRPGSGQSFGPEVTFGRTIADASPSDNFGLIKYAVSGSAIHEHWDPATGSVYSNFRTKVTNGLAALTAAGHTYEIVGMLWTQGERDARIGRTTAEYEFDLNELIADIRTRYGADLPFFLNRLSTAQTDLPDITLVRAAQESVAASDPFTYLIDADGMSFHDELHFDAAGQISLGEAFGQSYINSRVPDTTDPETNTLSPVNGAPAVTVYSNLVIDFNETIAFGTGFITIRETVGDAAVESFDVGTPPASLSLSGSTVTIDPTANLENSTSYYVEIDAAAIDDFAGNSFAGISGSLIWSFTTEAPDLTNPNVDTLNPANVDTDVAITANLEITFTETVAFGTGSITLKDASGTVVESFDVASPPANIILNGTTLTIDPTAALAYATGYYVEIDATAIDDIAGNSFAGFSGSGTWAFTTTAAGSDPTAVTFGTGVTATTHDEVNSTNLTAYSVDVSASDLLNGLTPSFDTNWFSTSGRTPANLVDGVHGAAGDVGSLAQPESPPATVVFDLGTGDNGLGYDLSSLTSIASWNGVGFGNQVWTLEVAGVGDDGSLTSTDFSTLVSVDYTPLGGGSGATKVTVTGLAGPLTSGVQYVRITGEVNPDGNDGRFTWREFDIFGASTSKGDDYAAWIDGFGLDPADQGFDDDPDGDGQKNGIENYFGTQPGEFSQGLVSGNVTGSTMTFTHPLSESPASDLTATYRWSKDLSSYHDDGDEFEGSTVSFSQSTPVDGIVTVTATTTGTALNPLFVRIELTQN